MVGVRVGVGGGMRVWCLVGIEFSFVRWKGFRGLFYSNIYLVNRFKYGWDEKFYIICFYYS